MDGAAIVVAVALFALVWLVERVFLRNKWMKPDEDVNPGWAYARWRLLLVAVCIVVFPLGHFISRVIE